MHVYTIYMYVGLGCQISILTRRVRCICYIL